MYLIIGALAALLPMIPAVFFVLKNCRKSDVETSRKLVTGLSNVNLAIAFIAISLAMFSFLAPDIAHAAGLLQETSSDPYASIGAGIAVGLGSLGAAYAVAHTGSAAIGVIAEKPESFGRVLIFVGLAEGVAIYGLIIAFMLTSR